MAKNYQKFDIISGTVTEAWLHTTRPSSYHKKGEAEVTFGTLTLASGKEIGVELDGEWKKGQPVTGVFDQIGDKGVVLYPVFETGSMTKAEALAEARRYHEHYAQRTKALLKAGMAVDAK